MSLRPLARVQLAAVKAGSTKRKVSPVDAAQSTARAMWDGRRIKEIREVLGLAQNYVAAKAGMQPSDIGRIEKNVGNPTVETIGCLAIGLGQPLFVLMAPVGSPVLVVNKSAEHDQARTTSVATETGPSNDPLLGTMIDTAQLVMASSGHGTSRAVSDQVVAAAVSALGEAMFRLDRATAIFNNLSTGLALASGQTPETSAASAKNSQGTGDHR